MRVLPCKVALLLILCCAGPAWAQSPAPDLLVVGDSLHAAFEYEAALGLYEQAQMASPDAFDVLWRVARTHNDHAQDLMADRQKDEAEDHFRAGVAAAEKLVDLYPDSSDSHFYLAATKGKLAQFSGGKKKVEIGRAVEEHASQAIELDPSNPLPYVALGIFNREVSELNWIQRTFAKALFGGVPNGSKEEAITLLRQALNLDPTLSVAHFEIALTYEMMDERNRAITHLRRTLDLPPYNSQDVRNQEIARSLLDQWDR